MDNLSWLQDWYATQSNGEWEHQQGVSIETLDNPGWALKVNLLGTAYADLPIQALERKGEENWIRCRISNQNFEAFGGAKDLDELIGIFRHWITSSADANKQVESKNV